MSNFIQSIEKRIALFLDNELDQKDETELISELKRSSECSKKLTKEVCFREYVRTNCPRKQVSNSLVSEIRNKIKTQQPPV